MVLYVQKRKKIVVFTKLTAFVVDLSVRSQFASWDVDNIYIIFFFLHEAAQTFWPHLDL